jgi:hypothetical protein
VPHVKIKLTLLKSYFFFLFWSITEKIKTHVPFIMKTFYHFLWILCEQNYDICNWHTFNISVILFSPSHLPPTRTTRIIIRQEYCSNILFHLESNVEMLASFLTLLTLLKAVILAFQHCLQPLRPYPVCQLDYNAIV